MSSIGSAKQKRERRLTELTFWAKARFKDWKEVPERILLGNITMKAMRDYGLRIETARDYAVAVILRLLEDEEFAKKITEIYYVNKKFSFAFE